MSSNILEQKRWTIGNMCLHICDWISGRSSQNIYGYLTRTLTLSKIHSCTCPKALKSVSAQRQTFRGYVFPLVRVCFSVIEARGVADLFCRSCWLLLFPKASAGPRLCRRPWRGWTHLSRLRPDFPTVCWFAGLSKNYQKLDSQLTSPRLKN